MDIEQKISGGVLKIDFCISGGKLSANLFERIYQFRSFVGLWMKNSGWCSQNWSLCGQGTICAKMVYLKILNKFESFGKKILAGALESDFCVSRETILWHFCLERNCHLKISALKLHMHLVALLASVTMSRPAKTTQKLNMLNLTSYLESCKSFNSFNLNAFQSFFSSWLEGP